MRAIDSSKAGLVLKHEPNILSLFRLPFALFGYFCFEFFLNPSWADSSALGCRRLGTIFRQPCLANIRYTVVSATLCPSFFSNAVLTSLTTRIPPLEATSKKPDKNSFSSSKVRYARRRPPHFLSLSCRPQNHALNSDWKRATEA